MLRESSRVATPSRSAGKFPGQSPVIEMRARSAAPLIDRCLRAASWPPLRALLHASPAPLAPKRARAEPSAAAPSGGGDAGDAAITSPEELSAALKRTLEHARRELAKLRGGSATPRERQRLVSTYFCCPAAAAAVARSPPTPAARVPPTSFLSQRCWTTSPSRPMASGSRCHRWRRCSCAAPRCLC